MKGLTIGNYVNIFIWQGESPKAISIPVTKQLDVSDLYGVITGSIKWEPTPITEEWLLKLGFEEHDGGFDLFCNENEITIDWDNITGLYLVNIEYGYNIEMRHIQYVHQLQNLYFSLTSKELTTK